MANLNVVVLGSMGYSKDLGKKGTDSDITFYNLKRGQDSVTFVEPTRYPERLAPLFYAVSLADKAILVVEEINANFGEGVLMLHSAGIADGLVVPKNYLSRDQMAPLIKGTVVDGYQFVEDDKNAIRERLLDEASRRGAEEMLPSGTIPVDHFFNVRGVGTVVLGRVVHGSIKKHDELMVLPGEKRAQVRSIQKHDQDFESAGFGDRAGLALKGISVEDLDRGAVLTSDPSVKAVSGVEAQAELVKYWSTPLKEGMVLHLGHWMQFLPARVEFVGGDDWHRPLLRLSMDKMLVYRPGDRGILTYPEGGKLRVVGAIRLP